MKLALWRTVRLPRTGPAALLIALGATAGALGPAGTSQAANAPVLNDIPPTPAMVAACATTSVSACNSAALSSINFARRQEGLDPLALPANFASLTTNNQIVVITNAERTSRGLPALQGPQAPFDARARQGAAQREDPLGPSGQNWVSNLAEGFVTPLQADYQWMYNDGPGGTNAGCTSTDRSECWEHRDNILSPWTGMIGVAAQPVPGTGQNVFAELLVEKA